ncbi:MAG: hypothetical protein C0392_04360 [Syntrophus sp. (in: bacteria)]|nr:hypothetical protein [Syntrophus sp. (in: bacteria)]
MTYPLNIKNALWSVKEIYFEEGRLLLGRWQQVVLAEFDNRPRNRQLTIQLIGE